MQYQKVFSVRKTAYSSSTDPYFNFVTTPIFYVNAEPHIGHLHSLLVADASSRFQSLLYGNRKRIFSTGTDEHGLKIEQAARSRKTSAQELCDQVSVCFRDLSCEFGIDFTRFIRTTDVTHKDVVSDVWKQLVSKGLIYKSKYEGWYSVSDECFATRIVETTKDGETTRVSEDTGNLVEWYTEENYMFRLTDFNDRIRNWLENKPEAVIPNKFRQMLLKSISSSGEVKDLSISRPRDRLSWGIPVPGDDTQTIYVWMDALFNYLTVAGYGSSQFTWPPSLQVIGKDILKFHAIYWPAFLMSLDLELPSKLVCHSHWTIDGVKMSKSKGNVVDPFKLKSLYGREAVRYFMLREAVLEEDATFTEMEMIRTVNSELSDTLGNLLSRCTSLALNPNQLFPGRPGVLSTSSQECLQKAHQLPQDCLEHFKDCRFNCAVDLIMKFLRSVNLFVQEHKPWQLKKEGKEGQLHEVLNVCLESVRVTAILLQPIIPETTSMILDKLSCPENERSFKALQKQPSSEPVKLSSGSSNIFPRISQ